MSLSDVPADRRCMAKTRARTPCKNWGIRPSGRCRMHGGKSLGGYLSPALKHGEYSTYFPFWLWRSIAKADERRERRLAALLAARLAHAPEETP